MSTLHLRQIADAPTLREESLPPPSFAPLTGRETPTVIVDPSKTFQSVLGVGGALTESAAVTLDTLSPEKRRAVLDAYFCPKTGAGYAVGRVHMNSCDFSLGNWACCEKDGDFDLATFSIEHYRESILPLMKDAAARASDGLALYFSPWSPPAWMKTTGKMNEGGQLRPECRDAWALHYVKFAQAFAAEGLPFWGLTVQNEPAAKQTWDSCLYTAEEERDFVRDHLGPALAKAGLKLNLMVWDHNREILYDRVKVVYDDPEASKYVWGAAFHWYVTDSFGAVRQLAEAWPDKGLMFSEGCLEGGADKVGWSAAEHYGKHLHHDFANGAHGWTDWNIVLDEQGGPNHVGNFCSAPVMVDRKAGTFTLTPAYYMLKYFSLAARPNSRRVACATSRDDLMANAFRQADGTVATVLQHRGDKPYDVTLKLDGQGAIFRCPPHSATLLTVQA